MYLIMGILHKTLFVCNFSYWIHSQSTAVNLVSLDQDTLQCSERFQPTSTGIYQLDYYLMSDSVTTETKSKSI